MATVADLVRALGGAADRERRADVLRVGAAPEAICAVDGAGRVVFANADFATLHGFGSDELAGRSYAELLLSPERRPDFEALIAALFSAGTDGAAMLGGVGVSDLQLRKDGSSIHVELRFALLAEPALEPRLLIVTKEVDESCLLADQCRASEVEHRLLLGSTPDGILVVDRVTTLVRNANAPMARLLSRPAPELVGRPLAELGLGADLEARILVPPGSHGSSAPAVIWPGDGVPAVHAEVTVLEALSAGGNCSIAVFKDVSDRIQVEEALRDANERLSTIFDAAPAAIFAIDAQGNVESWNEAAGRMFGWTAAEVIGRPLPFVPEEKRAEYDELSRRVRAGESIYGVEVTRRRKDGRPIDLAIWAAPLHDRGGTVIGIMAVLEDVTERNQVARSLRASEARYRVLAESAQDVIFIVDHDDRVAYVNPAGLAMIRRRADEVVGEPRARFFAPAVAQRQEGHIRSVLEKGRAVRVEQEFPDYGVWLETRLVPLGHDGGVDAVLGISRDVTERKVLERARGDFLASVSHELRTPLTLILGYTDLLDDEPLGTIARKAIDVIARRARQELRLVEELITLAAAEAGGIKLRLTPVAIGWYLEEYAGEARVMADRIVAGRFAGGSCLFEIAIDPGLRDMTIACDEARLRQVLDNLVENAVKYSLSQPVSVRLEAAMEGTEVLVRVRDKGVGIPVGEQERVFQPFYRVYRGEKRRPGGIGKGLAIARELVEAHGGRIWIESEPGAGTTVQFTLPTAQGSNL